MSGVSRATCDVSIVGGGPAGLTAALSAARHGARVTVYEQLPRPGLRLMASGGGRGNLTNTLDPESIMIRFGRRGRFIQPALAALSPGALRRWLADLDVPTFSPDGFHVYPVSESAGDVQKALVQACARAGVATQLECPVHALNTQEGDIAGLETARGTWHGRNVIIATGGRSYPKLGGGERGYALARQAGHTVMPPLPALVPLVLGENWPAACAGATLADVELRLAGKGRSVQATRGPLLFTHRGLSGPAALDISGEVSARLQAGAPVPVLLNLFPGRGAGDWRRALDELQRTDGKRLTVKWLDERLPRSVAEALAADAGLPPALTASRMTGEQRSRLADRLAGWPLTVTGTEGFGQAMVTRGGVKLEEIDPRTLASRLVRGLFFAGEVVDLDGPCGGFNLQWAFSSGYLAGQSAATRLGGRSYATPRATDRHDRR